MLKERKEKLDLELKPLESKLISLAEHENKLRTSIQDLDMELTDARLKLSHLNDAILLKNADINSLEKNKKLTQNSINSLDEQKSELITTINDLKASLSEMIPAKESTYGAVESLKAEKDALLSEVSNLNSEITTLHEEKAREVSIADSKLLTTRQDEALARKLIDKESRLLADRKLALDERERVLRIRETKANIQESAIQRNANLLDL